VNQQLKWNINDNTNISLGVRLTDEKIKNDISVNNGGATITSSGNENNTDQNYNISFNQRYSNSLKTSFRGYFTEYNAKQDLVTLSGDPYYDLLNHRFQRVENQTDWNANKNLNVLFGAGAVWEGVKSTRYDSEKVRKNNAIQYGFTQLEWNPIQKLILIGGVRFDKNEAYASAFSPKLSALYKINAKHKIKLSIGEGFKAPDFRQIYLDFTNAAAGGYSVFGTAQAQEVISQLVQKGQIGALYDSYYKLKVLKPEYSTGVHLSWDYEPNANNFFSVQIFRNDINNLITLCSSCHTSLHHWQRKNHILLRDEDIVRTLKKLREVNSKS
jgi:outer membrane receptor for ferrienterochelin and colicins